LQALVIHFTLYFTSVAGGVRVTFVPQTIDDPLLAPVPGEVPLRNAPLVRVIAQIRFPLVIAVGKRDFVAPFQEAIKAEYPVLREEQAQGLLIGPGVISQALPQPVWRFSDIDGRWRVSLAPEFLALETTAYQSRADFLQRLTSVVSALQEHVAPRVVDRLGLRYIDRVTGDALSTIGTLVRAEIIGIAATSVAPRMVHALSEALFEVDGARLLARWGQMPPNGTVDPAAIEPIPAASWILDLDMFSVGSRPFDAGQLISDARQYAERLYAFFRWTVTDAFLKRYGGVL